MADLDMEKKVIEKRQGQLEQMRSEAVYLLKQCLGSLFDKVEGYLLASFLNVPHWTGEEILIFSYRLYNKVILS